jgi:Asp-tRNA(Asn)/Glu-tRNA(Gln) amidotransferase A subunit family amidase/creatinine amidohydrolase/Fe(II)-dependent formamide hydrolase-like protein
LSFKELLLYKKILPLICLLLSTAVLGVDINHEIEVAKENATKINNNDVFNAFISAADDSYIENRIGSMLDKGLNPIPIAIKDNIDVRGLANTAGSIALKNNFPRNDAYLITKLKKGGYYVIGKTNLSEWANFRSYESASGWSSIGGQTQNPYGENRNPCGSSSGSAVAVAAGLVPVAIGTETNGSISCPSSVNGVVGIKPTVGLVSRSGIIPISKTQDTAGPMAKTVKEAARVLEYMAGYDPKDKRTSTIPADFNFQFAKNLNELSLQSKRIGLLSSGSEDSEGSKLLTKATEIFRKLGADVILMSETKEYPGEEEFFVLLFEFREGINKYLRKANINLQNLNQLIAFNNENRDVAMEHFGQEIFIESAETLGQRSKYMRSVELTTRESRNYIDSLLEEYSLDALVGLTRGPAWLINYNGGDEQAIEDQRSWGTGGFAAMSGYPHITIPFDLVDGLPVGISFISTAWDDKSIIEMAYAFEQENEFNELHQPPKKSENEQRLKKILLSSRPIDAGKSLWTDELTWMEVRDLIENGYTQVIIPTGGIEQNGPFLATGKHNVILKAACPEIAKKLGNTLCAPIIKFVPEGNIEPPSGAMRFPGTISLRSETYRMLLDDIASSLKQSGFKNIIFIGDSGGNQIGMEIVAKKLNQRWSGSGILAHYIPEYYNPGWEKTERFTKEVLGVEETSNDGHHDDIWVTAMMMVTDPEQVRHRQRIDAGLASINGVDITPIEETIELGRKMLEFRTEFTADAIRKAIQSSKQ